MKLAVGCVADTPKQYRAQALRLLRSWRWFAGRFANADFHLCLIGDVDDMHGALYGELGARVHAVDGFADRHPTSNKLRFFEIDEIMQADRILLLDCDTVVVREPSELFEGEGLTAKIVDVATVSLEVFARVFAHFGIRMPPAIHHCTVTGEAMIPYFNSGVISFSRQAALRVAPEWRRLNGELTGIFEQLGGTPHFCEQASLSVALAATGTEYRIVGNELNFPAHFRDHNLDSDLAQVDPAIIHYHHLVDDHGLLVPSPYPHVNRRIGAFNRRLLTVLGN